MARSFRLTTTLLMLAGMRLAVAQGIVEYSVGAGGAANATGPAQQLGKSMSGIWGGVNQAAKPTPSQSNTQTIKLKATRSTSSRRPAAAYEDPRQIDAGITYDELLRRFGPPSMSVTNQSGTELWYGTGNVKVQMRDGKVWMADGPTDNRTPPAPQGNALQITGSAN